MMKFFTELKHAKPEIKAPSKREHVWIKFSKSEEKQLINLLEQAAVVTTQPKAETKGAQFLLDVIAEVDFEELKPQIIKILETANIIGFKHFFPSEPALKVLFDILASNPKTILPSAVVLDLTFWGSQTPLKNFGYLQNVLKHNRSIENLYLKNIGDSNAVLLASFLAKNEFISVLQLQFCGIANLGANALITLLQTNKTLQELDLYQNTIGDEGIQALESLDQNKQSKLRRLDLRGNQITTAGALVLSQAYLNNPCFHYIGLFDNPIGDLGSKAYIEAVGTKFNKTNNPIKFAFDHSDFGSESFKALAKVLKEGVNVTSIEISSRKGMPGFGEFTEALAAQNSTVKNLTLDIHTDWQMAAKLGFLLTVNNSIELLSLKSNEMGDENMRFIIDGLKKNHTVINFDITNNNLTEKAAPHLKDLFITNKTLQYCNMQVNNFGDNGAMIISEGLSRNKTLLSFDFISNFLGPAGIISILEACKNNKTLKKLAFGEPWTINVGGSKKVKEESKEATLGVAFQQMVLHNNTMTDLTIDHASLTQQDLQLLIPVFKDKSNFESVEIRAVITNGEAQLATLAVIQHNPRVDMRVKLDDKNANAKLSTLATKPNFCDAQSDERFQIYHERLPKILDLALKGFLFTSLLHLSTDEEVLALRNGYELILTLINEYAQSDKGCAYPNGWHILERQPTPVFEKSLESMRLLQESLEEFGLEKNIVSIVEAYAANDYEGMSLSK